MAHIHNIAGSTKYLLQGSRPIHGKKFSGLEEIQHFYSHHKEVLAEAESIISRQHEEVILTLSNDEARLASQLQEGIAQRTIDVDREITVLEQKIMTSTGFLKRAGCKIRYLVAVSLRQRHIHSPFRNLSIDLDNVRSRKNQHIGRRQRAIQWEQNNIISTYEFLKTNESFLIGAQAEEIVINALSQLPDDYYVLNDVNLRFSKPIHWKKQNEWIRTCQIDHIVAGPTGIFLLETKNWKVSDFELHAGKIIHQVQRSGYALWYFTKEYYWKSEQPKIRNVVVSLHRKYSGPKLHEFIDVVTPRHVCEYILNRKTILSEESVIKFVDILTQSGFYFPRF